MLLSFENLAKFCDLLNAWCYFGDVLRVASFEGVLIRSFSDEIRCLVKLSQLHARM